MNLLMIGYRRDALEAAQARGWNAYFLVDSTRQPPRKACDWAAVNLDSPPETLAATCLRLTGNRPVDAIIALVEAAVVPAARLREHLGLDGLSVAVASRCHDKRLMKRALQAAEIPCARFEEVTPSTHADELVARLGLPLVLKAPDSSGGRGTRICRSPDEVSRPLSPGLMAESFIDGVEYSVESFVHRGEVLFFNVTSYLRPGWANIVPAALDAERLGEIAALNQRTLRALGITRGVTHLEFFAGDGIDSIGEVAVRPPGGALMELITDAYGFDAWQAFLEVELGRRPACNSEASSVEGVYFLHPGPGQVVRVHGVTEARALPHIKTLTCRVSPGDAIDPRQGVGQSVGRIRASGPHYDQVTRALLNAHQLVEIELAPGAPVSTSVDKFEHPGG
ncbi:hypothetical protein DL240_03750 [Lujinxingia litoralis]|uniref:ATP-grasp domain-containing protein n=1 Tax=Lujinxingia litoralis TaxID=2211119 RepID=A0A328CA39_9DELT|nr:ATP-grasp domain-containing protein [Lujinxingia litoralis]RAL25335.1 hypothetical protein DL240_03750 [Lujinxingia litoralis]